MAEHQSVVDPNKLHFSKFREFTGIANQVVPDFTGQILVAVDTNKIYRATGTDAGNIIDLSTNIVATQYTHWHSDSIVVSGAGLNALNNTNHPYLSWFLQLPSANTDSFKFFAPLAAGNYLLTILGIKNSDLGILGLSIDGEAQFTNMDWYDTDFLVNSQQSRPIVLVGDRNHEFVFSVNAKNNASANFFMGLTKFSLVKI